METVAGHKGALVRILDVGGDIVLLRFLPDGTRLLVATADDARNVTFSILSLASGNRVQLDMPGANLDSWWYHAYYGNPVAISPPSDTCYLAWGGALAAFQTADGTRLSTPNALRTRDHHQVVMSPGGDRLLAVIENDLGRTLYPIVLGPKGGNATWRIEMPPEFSSLGGFLPDGERFVTVDNAQGHVRIRSFETGEELAVSKARPHGAQQPQISSDGRYLGVYGYGKLYLWDLTTLEKPRRIGGTQSFGDFRSFSFHPDGRRMAVIHGGPTLVKVYDLDTLKQVHAWRWKVGPLRSVAYSPDGALGAAGSVGGQIVLWDEDS